MMFRVENNVPEVYVQESRDFQLLARLYDLVFQSSRFSIDSMQRTADTMHCNASLLPLLGTKVGLFEDLKLSDATYRKVLAAFPYIIKYKGSQKAIKLIINLFEQLINTKIELLQDPEDHYKITLRFVEFPPNIELLYALLDYIRPTGLIIDHIVSSTVVEGTKTDVVIDTTYALDELATSSNVYKESANLTKEGFVGFVSIDSSLNNVSDVNLNSEGETTDEQ